MHALGRYLTQGRLQAIIGLSFLTLMSMFIPPLAYVFSGASLGFITLRQDPQITLQVVMGSMTVIVILLLMTGINPTALIQFVLGIWLPVMSAAIVLRVTQSQGLMLLGAGFIGFLFILFMHYRIEDIAAEYRQLFEVFWQQHILPGLEINAKSNEIDELKQVFDKTIPYMNGIRACFITTGIAITVLVSRWWQAKVFHPGGFRKEFFALQLPKVLLIPLAVCSGIVFSAAQLDDSIARDCLILCMGLYVFQGIACVHAYCARKELQRGWLIGMYLALIFSSVYAVIILACIGVADSVIGRKLPTNDVS